MWGRLDLTDFTTLKSGALLLIEFFNSHKFTTIIKPDQEFPDDTLLAKEWSQ